MTRRGLALALGLLLAPAAASAHEPGVHLDPSSPAGKEYAIPLEAAQRVREPRARGDGSPPADRPLFGRGVRRTTEPVSGRARDAVRGRARDAGRGRARDAGRGRATRRPAAQRKTAPYLSTVRASDAPPALLIAGGSATAVLLLGGAMLALMRRGSRRSSGTAPTRDR